MAGAFLPGTIGTWQWTALQAFQSHCYFKKYGQLTGCDGLCLWYQHLGSRSRVFLWAWGLLGVHSEFQATQRNPVLNKCIERYLRRVGYSGLKEGSHGGRVISKVGVCLKLPDLSSWLATGGSALILMSKSLRTIVVMHACNPNA